MSLFYNGSHRGLELFSLDNSNVSLRSRHVREQYVSPSHRTLFDIFFATNAPYSVLMGDFLTADFQFLSSARMGKLPPWDFLPIDGRLVGEKL